jgi:histidine ammonia-lyase
VDAVGASAQPPLAGAEPELHPARASEVVIRGSLDRRRLFAIVDGARVRIHPDAAERMRRSEGALARRLTDGRHVYGVSSGVGDFRDAPVSADGRATLQLNIVRSHSCGVGAPLPSPLVRAALALRLATFAGGYSAVRPLLAEHLAAMLNARVHPVVPELGSVGASGDPVLLAHTALCAIGEGRAQIGSGRVRPSREALTLKGLEPLTLATREGLALINGLDFTIGAAALITARAERMLLWGDAIAALTLDALDAAADPFDAAVQALRGAGRHTDTAERIRSMRVGSPNGAHQLQDPYCLRCVPQVHGASWTALERFTATVDHELTAVIDNPLIFAEPDLVRHCGHFHGQELALAADMLALGLANLANITLARLSLLLRGTRGLPRMLATEPGVESGLMMLETLAASLVARMRASAAPLSIHNVPASSVQEDHTSMGWEAVRRTETLVEQLAYVLAAEALAAVTAARLRHADGLARPLPASFDLLAQHVDAGAGDRALSGELEALSATMSSQAPGA